MTELDNIEAGRPLRYPEQIPETPGKTGTAAALEGFNNVFTRALTVEMLISDPAKQRSTCRVP